MEKEKTMFKVIEVPNSGKKDWDGGAWCLVWVYSEKGNFLLKGFYKECRNYLTNSKNKCWAIFNLYHSKIALTDQIRSYRRPSAIPGYRTIHTTFNCDFKVHDPGISRIPQSPSSYRRRPKGKNSSEYKYTIYTNNYSDKIQVKRLPNRFVDFSKESKQS